MIKQIQYKKILVTHDGSKCASAVIPHAVSLANTFNAEIVLLQVVSSVPQEVSSMSTPGIGMYPPIERLGDEALKLVNGNKMRAKKQLETIKNELEEAGVLHVKVRVEEGLAQEIILYIAKKEKCDLIAMSTHGRTGIGKVLLGSVTEHVMHHAKCPVFIVRPEN